MPPDPAPIDLSAGIAPSLAVRLGRLIQGVIAASRWLLALFYVGLAAALAIFGLRFLYKVGRLAMTAWAGTDSDLLIGLLRLVDSALVASLVVMVMVSGYETFVSRIETLDAGRLERLGGLDPGSLKLKLAVTIMAIASIHLLEVLLNIAEASTGQVLLLLGLQGAFIAGAVALAVIERLDVHRR